jgi:glycoside/pentoside/hexuronide:cation symporter, GPH family
MQDEASGQGLKRVRWWEMAAFAAPSAPLLALSLPSLIFLGPYFNEHLGLSLSAIFALFLLARIADIVVDPMIGGFQDRSTPAMGRRRFWMVASTPVFMALIWIVFIGLPPGVPAWVVSLSVLAMYWCYASLTIAHLSWAGELQPDYHGRTRTLGAVQIAGMIGYVGMLLLPAIVTQGGFGDSVDAVHAMGWAGIIVLPLTVAWCVLGVKEDPSLPQPHLGFRAAMDALRTNAALRRVLIPDFLIGVGYGVTGSLFVFLARDYLGFTTQYNTLLLIYFLSGLVGIPLWTWAGRRFGAERRHHAGAGIDGGCGR